MQSEPVPEPDGFARIPVPLQDPDIEGWRWLRENNLAPKTIKLVMLRRLSGRQVADGIVSGVCRGLAEEHRALLKHTFFTESDIARYGCSKDDALIVQLNYYGKSHSLKIWFNGADCSSNRDELLVSEELNGAFHSFFFNDPNDRELQDIRIWGFAASADECVRDLCRRETRRLKR